MQSQYLSWMYSTDILCEENDQWFIILFPGRDASCLTRFCNCHKLLLTELTRLDLTVHSILFIYRYVCTYFLLFNMYKIYLLKTAQCVCEAPCPQRSSRGQSQEVAYPDVIRQCLNMQDICKADKNRVSCMVIGRVKIYRVTYRQTDVKQYASSHMIQGHKNVCLWCIKFYNINIRLQYFFKLSCIVLKKKQNKKKTNELNLWVAWA